MVTSPEMLPQTSQFQQKTVQRTQIRQHKPPLTVINQIIINCDDELYNDLKKSQFDFTVSMLNNEQVKLNIANAEEHFLNHLTLSNFVKLRLLEIYLFFKGAKVMF